MSIKRSGSIVVFALMMLSLIAIITQQLLKSSMVGSKFVKTMVDREHAEMLALGGINVAIAQLNNGIVAAKAVAVRGAAAREGRDETAQEARDEKKENPMQAFILHLLLHLNRWQDFDLDYKNDGVEGKVSICISSEHGKININEVFDFKKQVFKKEYEAILKSLEIPGIITGAEFLKRLEDFFKKRSKKIYDITELSVALGLDNLNVFYQPPAKPAKRGAGEPHNDVFLADIFTVCTHDATIDPLVFSDSIRAIFGLQRVRANDASLLQEDVKKIAEEFKPQGSQDWNAHWNLLQPLYGEKPKVFDVLKDIFSKSFTSKVYSVLSYAKVGSVEQRVYAIVQEFQDPAPEKDKKEQDKNKEQDVPNADVGDEKKDNTREKKQEERKKYFKVMKIYWL